ncbi:hypothetical protein B1992_10440 [Pseudoxanthomonas broegbernensis]|uniref:Uncharacterized protein n=1 Tax=Pseudoxanthomonas broegbernensis TaxID=83619 RepID=A0A7V8GLI5_9GAMM|nr:hypothetical protein [Pseudoxanthomonas broegbernensis]KAF1685883.1 hypothetical protein B1992_10440 [Pseudoxanthomonas broegbernensis]MBB6064104.1 hypothetical protein [Pseudoxanthomonas broegbernensis]
MSSPKNAKPTPPSPAVASKTNRAFAPRKSKDSSTLTHERIAADLDAFRKSGGKIEVLGVTQALKKIVPNDEASPPPRPANASPSKSRL